MRLHTGTAWIKAGRPEDKLGEETERGFCLTAEERLPEQWDVRLLPADCLSSGGSDTVPIGPLPAAFLIVIVSTVMNDKHFQKTMLPDYGKRERICWNIPEHSSRDAGFFPALEVLLSSE